jgi:hypothetical protein
LGVLCIASALPARASCKGHTHEAFSTGYLQTTTEIAARAKWRSEVRGHDGLRYTRWSFARDKNMQCRKVVPGRRWRCTARARPCDGLT